MKIKIAICTSEQEIQSVIESMILQIFKEYSLLCEIDVFGGGKECCENIEKEKYDIIFLDIELFDISGVEVGRYIRTGLQDEMLQIAYVSAKQEYAMELFEYRPINFLLKPLSLEKIRCVIDKYLVLMKQMEQVFAYKKGTKYCRVLISEIYYFSSRGRKVTIAYEGGKEEFYGTLKKISERVEGKYFLYVHQSFIINYHYIRKMEYEQVTLFDGTVIPISQSRRKKVRQIFLDWKKKGI